MVFPFQMRILGRLLMLGESVGREEVESTGFQHFVLPLVKMGILIDNGITIKTNGVYCQVVDGIFLFVSSQHQKGSNDIIAYFGEDSIKLSRHLSGQPGDKGLDFCCGSGIQTICLARRGLQMTGVDIQHEALSLAKINARRNLQFSIKEFFCLFTQIWQSRN